MGSELTWNVKPSIGLARRIEVFAFKLGEDLEELCKEAGELGSKLVIVTAWYGNMSGRTKKEKNRESVRDVWQTL